MSEHARDICRIQTSAETQTALIQLFNSRNKLLLYVRVHLLANIKIQFACVAH